MLMFGMEIMLIFGTMKVVMFGFVFFALIGILCVKKYQKHKLLAQRTNVIRSLPLVQYQSLILGEPEIECSICCCEYEPDDMVARLKCNERHMFHKACLTAWIKQGKNSCPICRSPIDETIEM